MTTKTSCKGCGMEFPSKSAVFRHLKETEAICLSPSDRQEYMEYQSLNPKSREKVIILYGYWIPSVVENAQVDGENRIRNGEDVARVLLQVLEEHLPSTASEANLHSLKTNRSYGHTRSVNIAQEDGTSAVTEVIATRLRPLPDSLSMTSWIQQMNRALIEQSTRLSSGAEIRILGRQAMPMGKFNAETDISHRRVEYLLPADFVIANSLHTGLPSFSEESRSRVLEGEAVMEATVPSFQRPNDAILDILTRFKHLMKRLTTHVVDLDISDASAVLEKQFHDQKRQRNRDYNSNKKNEFSERKILQKVVQPVASTNGDSDALHATSTNGTNHPAPSSSEALAGKRDRPTKRVENSANDKVLRRKRYHNFTPTVMAHEYLAYRRMDRFYHRATFRPNVSHSQRPFLALSLSGDMILTGQVARVVGLFVALARRVIDDDIVDCVFDETYPHLVPTPPLPSFAHYASGVYYISIEGKVKAILTPRKVDRYENGWNDEETIQGVREWQSNIRENVALAWLEKGIGEDGLLLAEQEWTEMVLKPWAVRAKKQLNDYRMWKKQNVLDKLKSSGEAMTSDMPNEQNVALAVPQVRIIKELESVDPTVPVLFEKVLFYLRKANESGLWPSTTPKRQLVMISSVADGNESVKPLSSSLSMAHSKAKNNKMTKSSAYVFVEGQGGASGSFSLGAMPGDKCIQPKGNDLFPELMQAAFALEVALCPHRAPSSTIAVNRNAQFRPHTDSGAGSGQSTSLIVGLGTYTGGELVVEGTMMDIRYKAVEFDGWKQRHWTMPFVGERYSLVWFTPKGCEGINFVS